MPYITKEAREELANGRDPATPGELNYLICCSAIVNGITGIHRRIESYRRNELLSYAKCNDIMGALDGARREMRRRNQNSNAIRAIEYAQEQFYRETVAPYEDQAIKRNGDIFR